MSNLDDLTAIILAGGKGTRLQSIINDRPKVMAPVKQTPFLFILLDNLIQLGIKNIIFSIGYKSEYIRQVVGMSYKGQKYLTLKRLSRWEQQGQLLWLHLDTNLSIT